MNEDVTTVSPTLGFIIKTIDFGGYDAMLVLLFLLLLSFYDVADLVQVPVEYM